MNSRDEHVSSSSVDVCSNQIKSRKRGHVLSWPESKDLSWPCWSCIGIDSSNYSLGLLFIFFVSILWSASSILVQYLDVTYQFESPFLVTYLGVSLFVILLPIHFIHHYFVSPNHNFSLAPTSEDDIPEPHFLTHKQHMIMAVKIAPVWFLANYFYNLSLIMTSITSSTVLASTGSVFTYLFAVGLNNEAASSLKFFGVLLAFLGSAWTSVLDMFQQDISYSWGDAIGLIAAVGYGAYTTLLSHLCPKDESKMSMNLLLGYMGLFHSIFWSPGLLFSVEMNRQRVSKSIFACLIGKGFIDNVLSDYLWARAVLLTSATVATVGLGLTIPMAFVSDSILIPLVQHWNDTEMNSTSTGKEDDGYYNGKEDVSTSHHPLVGATLVLVGFVLVNAGHVDGVYKEETEKAEDNDGTEDDHVVEAHWIKSEEKGDTIDATYVS